MPGSTLWTPANLLTTGGIWLTSQGSDETGGELITWKDAWSGYDFESAGAAWFDVLNPNDRLNNLKGYRDGAGERMRPVNADLTRWRYLHDGTGMTVVFCVNPNTGGAFQTFFDQINGTGGGSSCGNACSTNANNITWFITRGLAADNSVFSISTTGGVLTDGTPHVVILTYSETTSPKACIHIDGVLRANATVTLAPSAADASNRPFVGGRVNGTAQFSGDWAQDGVLMFPRVVTSAEIAALQTYYRRYGAP